MPFLLIALVLEEIIPLIAIYAPFMLPSTCILPSQRERIETKRAEKAKAFTSQYYNIYAELKRAENPTGFLPLPALRLTSAPTAICGYVQPSCSVSPGTFFIPCIPLFFVLSVFFNSCCLRLEKINSNATLFCSLLVFWACRPSGLMLCGYDEYVATSNLSRGTTNCSCRINPSYPSASSKRPSKSVECTSPHFTLSLFQLSRSTDYLSSPYSGAMGLASTDLQSRLSWWLDAVKDSSTHIDDTAIARRLALVIHTS